MVLITADVQFFTNFVWTTYLAEQYRGHLRAFDGNIFFAQERINCPLFRLNLQNHDTSTSCANSKIA